MKSAAPTGRSAEGAGFVRASLALTILSLASVLGLITCAVITLSTPTAELSPIGIGLQSYTNACAVFNVTNLSRSQIKYVLKVEHKTMNDWPKYGSSIPQIHDPQMGVLLPQQVTNLTVPVMVYAPPYPWRLSIFCLNGPMSQSTLRFKTGLWALRLHLPKLARKLLGGPGGPQIVQVSGPEVPQQ